MRHKSIVKASYHLIALINTLSFDLIQRRLRRTEITIGLFTNAEEDCLISFAKKVFGVIDENSRQDF